MSMLFGPLGEKYCNLFLAFSILSLVMFVITLVSAVVMYFKMKSTTPVFITLLNLVGFSIVYLQNRLFYNMCLKAH